MGDRGTEFGRESQSIDIGLAATERAAQEAERAINKELNDGPDQ